MKEILVGLANGIANGLVAALIILIWFGFSVKILLIAGIIAVAMMINLVLAAIGGTLVPVILKRLKADPALASTVFVTTITDVGGFLAFLGLAALLIKYLV